MKLKQNMQKNAFMLIAGVLVCVSLFDIVRKNINSAGNHELQKITWVFSERNPEILAFYDSVIADFEEDNPGIEIDYRYMARFTQRLPTLVASSSRPDIIFTQGADLLQQLYDMGAIRDITPDMQKNGWGESFLDVALDNFRYDDRIIGVPNHLTRVDLYYNKQLFARAGIDPESIIYWSDFLDAIEKLKQHDIIPIAAGPADPWTVGVYFGFFAMRTCGYEKFQNAVQNEAEGFEQDCFLDAARMIAALGKADAFQNGFAAAKYPQAIGLFGDGRAAMVMSYSATTHGDQRKNASDGVGLDKTNIGLLRMPLVKGVEGASSYDVYGGVGGWAVMDGASDAAIAFLRFLTNAENQKRLAALNLNIPANKEAGLDITDPLLVSTVNDLEMSDWMQMFLENVTPAAAGQVMMNSTVELMSGTMTPEDAVTKLENAAQLGGDA